MQRCGYALAMWAAANSLLALLAFRPTHTGDAPVALLLGVPPAVVSLLLGWAVVVLACLAVEHAPQCCRRCFPSRGAARPRRRLPRGEGGEEGFEREGLGGGVGGVMRGPTGVVKRWWDIATVAAPRQELVAPRLRLGASAAARQVINLNPKP